MKELKKHKSVKILDCTLRDGGYYNNWKFSKDLISDYLYSMKEANLDWVEFGFRFLNASNQKNSCAFATDEFISSFKYSDDLNIAVMINASDFISEKDFGLKILKKFFISSKKSPVKLVRVACHLEEVKKSEFIFKFLFKNGYKVGINLMQISEKSNLEIKEFSKFIKKFPFEVVYFADSLGSLFPNEIKKIIDALKSHWKGEIGFHAHDNMGNALENSLTALREGATWIDATVLGMGRGPGNVQTEYLLMSLQKKIQKKINIIPLLNCIDIYFQKLRTKYQWGKNPFYFLAGQNKIHPTFIQEMLSDTRYTNFDILQAIEFFKEVGGQRFNQELLDSNKISLKGKPRGNWNPRKVLNQKELLIIGPSKKIFNSVKTYESLKKNKNLITISCNTSPGYFKDIVNYHVACHPIRILADFSRYQELNKKIILPFQILDKEMKKKFKKIEHYDFGVSINEEGFSIGKNGAAIPFLNVLAYSLAIALAGNASKVYLLGFEGYKKSDLRQKEMKTMFSLFSKISNLKIYSLNETSYNLPKLN
tara:strand:+ start:87 stop:1697 length:1611 start_codon:yes stop_codon:yes gene_type:complete